jgi:hypothetical protein
LRRIGDEAKKRDVNELNRNRDKTGFLKRQESG